MKIDLTGKRYGKLNVLEKTEEKKNGSYLYKCKCDCGNIKYITARDLSSGRVKACQKVIMSLILDTRVKHIT